MRFNIRGKSVDMDITSIGLTYDSNLAKSPDQLILWHCPICNNPIFQYSARLVFIFPGKVESKIPVLVNCDKCKHKYMIVMIAVSSV